MDRLPKLQQVMALWKTDSARYGLLTLVALGLYWLNLGTVALRDWDEGTIAQVAAEMARAGHWLHPTLHGAPYLNKPPLIEWLMAISYRIGGINEWTARLLPAGVSALAVPLMYAVGRQVRLGRTAALWAAGVYLTLLPVVRHGRLAMRDGVAVTLLLALLLCLLRTRQDRRWSLGAGLALGLLALTKGILALLLGAIAALFLAVNRQGTLLRSPIAWAGLGLGCLPAIAWYGAQIVHYGEIFWQGHFLAQSFARVWEAVDEHQEPVWYYGLEIAKYAMPWLLFWPSALVLAWQQRRQDWAQLVLVGTIAYLGAISVMGTKLPWYVLPVYPFLALAVGAQLGQIWQQERPFFHLWGGLLGVMGMAGLAGGIYLATTDGKPLLGAVGVMLGLSWGRAALQIGQRDRLFILTLIVGMYSTLLVFVASDVWLWELNEAYPVKPVAALVRTHVPQEATVYTTFPYQRPSLNFYCDRPILPITPAELAQHWQPQHYFLIEQAPQTTLSLPPHQRVGTAAGMVLIVPDVPVSGSAPSEVHGR